MHQRRRCRIFFHTSFSSVLTFSDPDLFLFVKAKSTSELPNAEFFLTVFKEQTSIVSIHRKTALKEVQKRFDSTPGVPPRLKSSMCQKKAFNLDMETVQPRVESTSTQPCQKSKEKKELQTDQFYQPQQR